MKEDNKIDYTQRVVSSVSPPVWNYLPKSQMYDNQGNPRVKVIKEHLVREGRIEPNEAIKLVQRAAEIYKKEPNLLLLQDPITVCGDIHGQFYDLIKLLEIGGEPGKTKYLFLGDYVDRGCFGTEVCFLLMSYKILYPNKFFMIRGNHECRHLTAHFNFKQECLYKYNERVYNAIMDCFDCLPLGALLNGRFLCVHGGLSPDIKTIEEINIIDRFREPPSRGTMCDLLWADPMDEDDESLVNPNATFVENELRGCSYVFSYNAVNNFLKNNNLLSVIRAHEAQDEGFRLYRKGNTTGFPTVICIFSAPNYCDMYNNKGAIIRFKDNLMNIRQFNCSPHPYYLPNFINAFNWSLPFVVEKVMDMFQVIIKKCDDEDLKAMETGKIDAERAEQIKSKIRAVGRMSRMFKTLRSERESIIALKGLAGGTIPKGILMGGAEAIRNAVKSFEEAKKVDRLNEQIPEQNKPGPGIVMGQAEIDQRLKTVQRVRAETPPSVEENYSISVDQQNH